MSFQMGASATYYNRPVAPTDFEMNRTPMFSTMSQKPPDMMDYNFGYMTNDRMPPMTNDLNFCCDDRQDDGCGGFGTSGYDRYTPSHGGDDDYDCGFGDDCSSNKFC